LAHPLDSACALTERAIEQIGYLQNEIGAFLKLHPYRLVGENYPDPPARVEGVIVRGIVERQIPIRFNVLIGEIVHGLRTALDHIVWQLVIANGKTGNRHTGFPVCETPEQFETDALGKHREVEGRKGPQGKIERVSAEAQAVIESLQPYNTSKRPKGSALYRLHHLDRIHKHRALHIIGAACRIAKEMSVDQSFYDPLPDGTIPLRSIKITFPRVRNVEGDAFIPFESGAEVFRVSANYDMQMQQKVTFHISFEEPGVVQGLPVIPVLHDLLNFTASTFDTFLMRFFPEGVEGAHQTDPSDPK
jgi:hypothetical protein